MSELTKLEREFMAFHAANPQVYELFKRFVKEAMAAGHTRFSVSLIIERIRWEESVVTKSSDEFKINNNHRAYYARKFMQEHPQFGKLFEIRVTKGQKTFGTDVEFSSAASTQVAVR